MCFFQSHSISILRTSLFHCFVFKWSGSQAGGCSSEDEWVGGRGGKRVGESAFGVRFLWTRSLWGDDSWRNALLIPLTGVTWPLGSFTFQSNFNSLGGQAREKCLSIMCVSYTVYAHYDFMSFRSSSVCRNTRFVTAPWNQTVWLRVAFPSGQTRLHLPATMSTASDTFLSVC